MIRAYATRTGTKRALAGLREAGWGLLVSAYGEHRTEGFEDHMLDNGAWSAWRKKTAWDASKFEALLGKHAATASQIVAPDIVRGGKASLVISLDWLPRLLVHPGDVLIPAQDGLDVEDLRPHVGGRIGLAIGGSAPWKWTTLATWCELGRERGCRVHVLRANSRRMIKWAGACGAYSFDGSGPSLFADCLPRMDSGRAPTQMTLTGLGLPAPFKPRSE